MDNYKIKVKDEAESKEAQELFFELGYKLYEPGRARLHKVNWISSFDDGEICLDANDVTDHKELTLPQLRDLVAQSKLNLREYLDPNDKYKLCLINPSDAAHWMIEVPESADCLMQWPTGHKVFYRDNFTKSWNNAYKEWHFVIGDDGIDQSSMLWKRTTQDPALISGADVPALIKKGESVQFRSAFNVQGGGEWKDLELERDEEEFSLGDLINTRFEWRLKPQTIKLELELPKPFEPKEGEKYWHIYPSSGRGYHFVRSFEDDDVWCQFGAWRTEEEIKQVVEQLRKIRGTNS